MKALALAAGLVALQAAPAAIASADAEDNGTDPTKLSRTLIADWEHVDLKGAFRRDNLEINYRHPLAAHTAITVNIPGVSTDVAGNTSLGLGDVSLKLSHIPVISRTHGVVLAAEVFFDSAHRPEQGNGTPGVKLTFTYARFLEGAIFAPSFNQSVSKGRSNSGERINNTVVDFYYVPRLADKRYYVTLDPAITFDWESSNPSASFGVTLGRMLGPAFGGQGAFYVKPTVFAGAYRSADWSLEIGYKVIGF